MSTTHTPDSGGYRIKFRREEFLRLLSTASPKRVYKVKDFYYFNFDGFVMYCEDVHDEDMMHYDVFHAIEFSNYAWTKT